MKFHPGQIYHIFNQGNNHDQIFFEEENYLFFLRKIRKYISPYANILCYCLMPNHFHFLLLPNILASEPGAALKPGSRYSSSKNKNVYQEKLSQNLGVLLSSYTKAINRRYHRSGSLFREKTKVKDGWIDGVVTVGNENKKLFFRPDNDYALHCFQYIHENPVKANLVKLATDWSYSSARDYAGLRNGTLCNQELSKEILGV